jgi:pimeloyl-ACP methyl ester carboxylesterase
VEARVLEYDQAGSGEPPFVLLPGGLTGWQSWLPLVSPLAELRRVVRVQPMVNAEGIAGRVGDGSYDAAIERESLLRTLASAGVDEMHLVGWSNGGRMALDLALAQPQRVRTLTMIEPAAWWLVTDRDASARRFADFIGRCAGRELSDDAVVEEFLLTAGFAEGVDFKQLPQWDFWSSCRQTLSWYDERAQRSAAAGIEGFERLAVPTLLICGTTTAPWLRAVVDLLARGLPDATVVDLQGGHACLLESAEDFVAALRTHTDGGDG